MRYHSLAAIAALSACTVDVPQNNTTSPTLLISMFDPQVTTIASTDPNMAMPRGCPAGSSANIIDVEAYFDRVQPEYVPPLDPATFEQETYFYKSAPDAAQFWVIARDLEGLSSITFIGHDFDSDDPRSGDFFTRPNANIPDHEGDYTPAVGGSVEYGVISPFDPNMGDHPIISHDLRLLEEFREDDDGTLIPTTRDGAILRVAPFDISGSPVIYASATVATIGTGAGRSRVAVRLLPQELCRPDADG